MATAKVHTAAQDSSVKGSSLEKACGTFSLKTEAKADVILAVTLSYFARATSAVRNIWVKPRNHTFLDVEWSNEEWKANFRVSRETFRVLCSEMASLCL